MEVILFSLIGVAMIISLTMGIHMIFSCVPYIPKDYQLCKGRLWKGVALFLAPCVIVLWFLWGML